MQWLDNVSNKINNMLRRKMSYQECFKDKQGNLTAAGTCMLQDLTQYCNAFSTSVKTNRITGTVDPYAVAFEEGKRAVLNRIKHYINLDDESIYKLYKELDNNE